jgi:hypothetical protein
MGSDTSEIFKSPGLMGLAAAKKNLQPRCHQAAELEGRREIPQNAGADIHVSYQTLFKELDQVLYENVYPSGRISQLVKKPLC